MDTCYFNALSRACSNAYLSCASDYVCLMTMGDYPRGLDMLMAPSYCSQQLAAPTKDAYADVYACICEECGTTTDADACGWKAHCPNAETSEASEITTATSAVNSCGYAKQPCCTAEAPCLAEKDGGKMVCGSGICPWGGDEHCCTQNYAGINDVCRTEITGWYMSSEAQKEELELATSGWTPGGWMFGRKYEEVVAAGEP